MSLYGIDASHHQGVIDFGAVKRAGNTFAFLKATEGTGYTDPTFAANRAKVRAAGLIPGAYHFASATDPVAEADYFCRVVGALQTGDLVALDWETSHPNPPAWCKAWLDRVTAKLGVRPLIYMSRSNRDGYDWTPVVAGNFGLWLAQPDGTEAVPGGGHWPAVAIKQFTWTGSVPGVSGACDRNVFFGGATALAAYGFQGADVPLTAAEIDAIAQRSADKVWTAAFTVLSGPQKGQKVTAGVGMRELYQNVLALLGRPAPSVDPKALAAAIVSTLPAVQAQEVASLVLTGLDGAKLNVTPPAA